MLTRVGRTSSELSLDKTVSSISTYALAIERMSLIYFLLGDKIMFAIKTLNDKGGIGYESTGSNLLDLFTDIGNSREHLIPRVITNIDNICNSAGDNDHLYAMVAVLLAYMRDRINGCGHRASFYQAFIYFLTKLAENKGFYYANGLITQLLKVMVDEYGRYDDLFELVEAANEIRKSSTSMSASYKATLLTGIIYEYAYSVMNKDIESDKVSLLGKWLPSINTSSKRTRKMAQDFLKWISAKHKKISSSAYRKICSKLRKKINIVEHDLMQRTYEDIDYSKVPSLALLKYKKAWIRNDEERYRKYLEDVASGKKTIHTDTVTVVNLIKALETCKPYQQLDEDTSATVDLMWANLKKHPTKYLVCRDGSGSMYCKNGYSSVRPIDVADALTLYCAENNSAYKDLFITFGEDVQVVRLHGEKFSDRVSELRRYDDCRTTNFAKVFAAILSYAEENHLTQDQLPEGIIVISDMQFDSAFNNTNASVFQSIKRHFERSGYTMPKLIFWCVTGKKALPICNDDTGATMLSGWNQNLIQYFVYGEDITPTAIVKSVLNSERYIPILQVFEQARLAQNMLRS